MIEDKKIKIMSKIAEMMLLSENELSSEKDITAKLLSHGFTLNEIKEALELISKSIGSTMIKKAVHKTSLPPISYKGISRMEEIKMTEGAITLFSEWKKLKLFSEKEEENIFLLILNADVGAVDVEELWDIAKESAEFGSKLFLHVSTRFAAVQ